MLYIFHNSEAALVTAIIMIIARVPGAMTANPITSFMKFLNEGTNLYDQEPEDQQRLFKEYDFIIVGAGTAGATLANRLSEIPEWQILLVEAGSKENYVMDIPIVANYLQFTDANWAYKTMPSDTACLGFNGKQCNWPRGKVMGGSSVLNYMIYTRGNKRDYDQWYEMGNEGWSWKDVFPYFKKVENYNIPEFNDPRYHKQGGYLNIEEIPFKTTVANAWVKGAQEAGYKYGDYNGEYQTRVSYLQLSMKNGTRQSSSRAYLHPIYKRKNLHVTKMSMVSKIIIDPYMKTASGIVLEKHNRKYKVYARKEVILCAGAINSPQLLMLSGIGPRDHLESLGIPTLVDLKVGYNLMDHIAPGGLTYMTQKQNISIQFQYIMNNPRYIFEWMDKHDGPLSVPGGCEALVFIDLNNRTLNDGWANMELLMISGALNNDPLLRYNFGFRNDIYDRVFGPLADKPAHMIFPMLMRPKSKGRLMLKNRNPKSYPLLYPNYLTHPDDIRAVVEGIKASIEISKQPSMKKIGTKIYSNPIKECLQYGPFGSDEYWACHARMFTFTIYHQSGTCKMGPATDSSAVVDPRLRVYGIRGLRVMDASIIPEIPSGHTNAPTFMIAEKGSDIVKEDWGKLRRNKRFSEV